MAELCANYETGLLYLTADGFIEGTPTVVGAGDLRVRATCQTAKGEQPYQVAGAIPEGASTFWFDDSMEGGGRTAPSSWHLYAGGKSRRGCQRLMLRAEMGAH